MAGENKPCNEALILALTILTQNEELSKQLIKFSEQSQTAWMQSDAYKRLSDEWTEWNIAQAEANANLLKEWADIKFKAAVFASVLWWTEFWDEAVLALVEEMKNWWNNIAEALNILDAISTTEFSDIKKIAEIIWWSAEEADNLIKNTRDKLTSYIWGEYSIISSWSTLRVKKAQNRLKKELDAAEKRLEGANKQLENNQWKLKTQVSKPMPKKPYDTLLKNVEADLKIIEWEKWSYWISNEWKAKIKKLSKKYWFDYEKKTDLYAFLSRVKHDNEVILANQAKANAIRKEIKANKWEISKLTAERDIILWEYNNALKSDLKLIKDWKNPFNFVEGDWEWKFIKDFNDNPDIRAKQYWEYVIARTFLTDDWTIWQEVYDMLSKLIKDNTKQWVENYVDTKLTLWWVNSPDRTLEDLMWWVYTHIRQISEDWQLRQAIKDRMIQLATDEKLSKADMKFINDIINLYRFADAGIDFSNVLIYQKLSNVWASLWLNVGISEGRALYKWISDFFLRDDFEKIITSWQTFRINKRELNTRQLLELSAAIIWDNNITKAIASEKWWDKDILKIAGSYITWDKELWNKKFIQLLNAVRATPTTDDTRWIIFRAISSENVPGGTKIAFFNTRDGIEKTPETSLRANFRDRLAWANTIDVTDGIEDYTSNKDTLIDKLKRDERVNWWFIVVPDSQWKMSKDLSDALDEINAPRKNENKIRVLFPRWWMSANFAIENWKLKLRISSQRQFNELMGTLSVRALWDWAPNSKLEQSIFDRMNNGDETAFNEFNKKLDEDARAYFAAMLWLENKYDEKLIPMLEQRTGILFDWYYSTLNKADFWSNVDDRFTLMSRISWNLDYQTVKLSDIINDVRNATPSDLSNQLSNIFKFDISEDLLSDGEWVKKEIQDAYIWYITATNSADLLQRKGNLLAVINWWDADSITLEQFRDILKTWDFASYRDIFFKNSDIDEKEIAEYINKINDMIFDSLAQQTADNLVKMWYSIPREHIRQAIYDYMRWWISSTNKFAISFMYKNWLTPSTTAFEEILYNAMPNKLDFRYIPDEINIWIPEASDINWWYINRLVETENKFMPSTYSSLVAMSALSRWDILPLAWDEYSLLKTILDNYYDTVSKAVAWWKTLSFEEAQRLKTQVWYALDMFEQDYLNPKYQNVMNADQKTQLFWLRYWLWIAVDESWLKTISDLNNKILDRYSSATSVLVEDNRKLLKSLLWDDASKKAEVEARIRELIDKWYTIKSVWNDVIVVDTRIELEREIRDIPANVFWLDDIKSLWRQWISKLSNSEAYYLLNVVKLAKNADNKLNMIKQTIYKLNPSLAQIDFLNRFKPVDWVPQALRINLLNNQYLWQFNNTAVFDDAVKKDIFSKIKSNFARKWTLSNEELLEIIDWSIKWNQELLWETIPDMNRFIEESRWAYNKAFSPYTMLVDVPKWVKDAINDVLSTEENELRRWINMISDKSWLWGILNNIYIWDLNWDFKSLDDILNWKLDNISKEMFDTEDYIIKSADEVWLKPIDDWLSERDKIKRKEENARTLERINNQYREWLNAYLNDWEIISQWEKLLHWRIMQTARWIITKYSSTSKFSDVDYKLTWLNEEIVRWFKSYILWFEWMFSNWNFWDEAIKARWVEFKKMYNKIYPLSDIQFANFNPRTNLEKVAYNMANYFKTIEQTLWSLDWVKWVSVDTNVNRAFAHIWEIVTNINDIDWVFSLMSWIEWNQFLKFFHFSQEWQLSYVRQLRAAGKIDESAISKYRVWYRKYIDTDSEVLDRNRFNKTFWTDLSDKQYLMVYQWLSWATVISKNLQRAHRLLRALNSSSVLERALISWPLWLITIWNQLFWYWFKKIWWKKRFGINDMNYLDKFRLRLWIWEWAYNELPTLRYSNYFSTDVELPFNKYWVPNVTDVYEKVPIYSSDDVDKLYSKIDTYFANEKKFDAEWFLVDASRAIDAYKDNVNNIIDWINARDFKNIAFESAIQTNSYMRFASAKQFEDFLASSAPEEMKQQAIEAIKTKFWRDFRFMLWIWFGWLDRAVAAWWKRNLLLELHQMVNFRWGWWRNIFNQMSNLLQSTALMIFNWVTWKVWLDDIVQYISHQPEYLNFVRQVFDDLYYSWRLIRIQDNDDFDPTEDWAFWMLDFGEYIYDSLNFVSQTYQWLESYWTFRIWEQRLKDIIRAYNEPELFADTWYSRWGIWWLLYSISQNFGRNWKLRNYAIKRASYIPNYKWEWALERASQDWFKLSAWGLRYMYNTEDWPSWFNWELIQSASWIPTAISWESAGWDKDVWYDFTRMEVDNLFGKRLTSTWDERKEYRRQYMKNIYTASQLWGTLKNVAQWIYEWHWSNWLSKLMTVDSWLSNPYDISEWNAAILSTRAGMAMQKDGIYIPTDPKDVEILVGEILDHQWNRPWNDAFNNSMFNFDKFWYMWWTDYSNESDLDMEMLLDNIKYEKNEDWTYKVDSNWDKIVSDEWKTHMDDMVAHSNDKDYMTAYNYIFVDSWVEQHNTDPNYMLYKRQIAGWMAWRMIENAIDTYVKDYNDNRLAGEPKIDETELKKWRLYDVVIPSIMTTETILWWERMPLVEALMYLDKPDAENAEIKMIERQLKEKWDTSSFEKFFTIDDKWEIDIWYKYKEYLKEESRLADYLNKWDLDSFRAETASITNLYRSNDPTWAITLANITARIKRIYWATTLTPEQKAAAANVLFTDNYDFIQQHVTDLENILLWVKDKEWVDALIADMNEALYSVDAVWTSLSYLIANNEEDWKGWWWNAWWLSNMAKNIISNLKWVASKVWWNWSAWAWYSGKNYKYDFMPPELKWSQLILKATNWKWYRPSTVSSAIEWYTPHVTFDIWKDVKRKTSRKGTQKISTSSSLASLEEKATKALSKEA